MTHEKKQLTPSQQAGAVVMGLLQFTFAFLAAWDLALRPAHEIHGRKAAWAAALCINWIGPASYFLFGIRHDRR